MPKARGIVRVLLGLVVAAAAVASVLYLLASRIPGSYRPARLGRADRERVTSLFYRRVMDFTNAGEASKPFQWSVTQQALNAYLGSMDEIAYRGGAKRGVASRMMEQAGLADPAVALDDGTVRLMVRSVEHGKILSVSLRLEITPDGQLGVRLAGARIGQAPVPKFLIREQLERLKAAASARLKVSPAPAKTADRAVPVGLARLLGRVVAAIDGQPVSAELTWRVGTRKRAQIDRIDIDDGVLTLHVVPVGRASSRAAEGG